MGIDKLVSLLKSELPLAYEKYTAGEKPVGLVIVDEVNGFATVGAGNSAPVRPSQQIDRMIDETDRLAREFIKRDWPVLAFMDLHEMGISEPPWSTHCERGSGEEKFVPKLEWLDSTDKCVKVYKDCADGFVGATRKDKSNQFVDWVSEHKIEHIVVVGTCTDVCVLDFVVSALSARNHKILQPLAEIYVYADACATSDMPMEDVKANGKSPYSAHPQEPTHYMGLYIMSYRGARLVESVNFK